MTDNDFDEDKLYAEDEAEFNMLTEFHNKMWTEFGASIEDAVKEASVREGFTKEE